MFKKIIYALPIFMIISSLALGEPKQVNENAISPSMEKQLNELSAQVSYQLKSTVKVMSDPELIKGQAKYAKSLYEAFIAEGFTKEQSLELVKVSIDNKK